MILSYTTQRIGEIVTVTVASDLAGAVVYHWYRDGAYLGASTVPEWTFYVGVGEQARIAVVDTTDEDFDPEANNPEPYPATRRLWWIRSLSADTDHYRVEQQADGGDWELLATVAHDGARWSYEHRTGRLDDLADYAWRVVPVDRAGNQGAPLATEAEFVVRTPDAPSITLAWDSDTGRVTIDEA